MKKLKDFEKELNKCSKCGQCETVCPIYKINHNECTVSKGKFIMLNGVTKGDLKFSKKINKYLDMCLKCNKCTKYCPAGIDAVEIFNIAKHEYMRGKYISKIINFLQSKLIFSNIIKVFKNINKLFLPRKKIYQDAKNLIWFKGCVNNIIPEADKYINKIFKQIPINIIEPDFECCGLPFLSEGNLKEFERVAKHNLELLKSDYDYIVTDCASCESTLMDYRKYIPDFDIPDDKFLNWGELIAQNNIKFIFNKNVTVTFHKPCHLKDDNFLKKILKNCINIRYIEMDDYDNCCGCAGTFMLKNTKLSKKISENKVQNILKTEADYVITTCPSCIFGLKKGLSSVKHNKKIKVISLLEFLTYADEILY